MSDPLAAHRVLIFPTILTRLRNIEDSLALGVITRAEAAQMTREVDATIPDEQEKETRK